MVESFWAIPDGTTVRTPLRILREQASALTEQTNGMIVGRVETQKDGDDLVISLELTVPALNDYRYRILSYRQPIEIYPGKLEIGYPLTVQVAGEDSFVKHVKAKLSSDGIKNVLGSLLAQVTEA